MRTTLIAFTLALATAGSWAAGRVDVSFAPVDQLADIGRDRFDGERQVKALASHFESLGQRLPDGQVLTVEVLDLNQAGEMKPSRRGSDLRVLRGGADWPSMTVRWTLKSGTQTLASREERVTDMNYLMQPLRGHEQGPLGYELRMVERWFDERFGPQGTVAASH